MKRSGMPLSLDMTTALFEDLAEAALQGSKEIRSRYRKARRPAREPTRQPGETTPMWNALVANLKIELTGYGSKARLARYLGLPRQRLHNFLMDNSRMPDAETTLRLLHWLVEHRSGRDVSL